MKNLFFILLVVSALLPGTDAKSQNPGRFPVLRERIAQAKLREIKISLKLDQATFEKFRPVYLKYERDVSEIDFRKAGRLLKVDADSLSSSEANQLIINQLETAKKLISIREEYYKEFSAVISPQKIIKLYQTEAELRRKVMQELNKRFR